MSKEIQLSLVLACYCDAPHLENNVLALVAYLERTRLTYEILLVEDCSPDNTADEVRRVATLLRERGVAVTALFHTANQGRGATVQDGFLAAQGNVVCYIDIDLEHRPDAMLSMYARIESDECDGVVAKRLYAETQVRFSRLILSRGYRAIVGLVLTLPVSDTESGFKMFRREQLLPVLGQLRDKGWFWDTEIVACANRAGLRLVDHPIVFVRDRNKQSTVRVVRDTLRYVWSLWRFACRHKAITSAVAIGMHADEGLMGPNKVSNLFL